MSKKNIIAQQLDINTAFRGNPHYVMVNHLINSFITYVEPETELISLENDSKSDIWDASKITAKESGFFIPNLTNLGRAFSREELKSCVLGWLFDRPIEAVDYLLGNPTSEIMTDPFTKTKSLELEWDGLLQSYGRFQIGNSLFIKFDYIDNTCVLSFHTSADIVFNELNIGPFPDTNFVLSPNDTISILFDDDSILDFKSIKKSSFCCVLHQEDFDAFTQKKIVATRISYSKGNIDPVTMEFQNTFFGICSEMALVLYIRKYVASIIEIHPHYNLPDRTTDQTIINNNQDQCFVYLMLDTVNGYYKIGISNKPDYRERTLQSEKPSIEMIASKRFPNRKIAMAIESALHTSYSQQRIRGEWFNLNDADVAAIIETLK